MWAHILLVGVICPIHVHQILMIPFHMMTFEQDISQTHLNHPYIAIVHDGESTQIFLVVERIAMTSCTTFMEAKCGIVVAYFVFDIAYPKSLETLLLFIQHLVMGVRDTPTLPPIVTQVYSALEALVTDCLVYLTRHRLLLYLTRHRLLVYLTRHRLLVHLTPCFFLYRY